MSNNVPAVGTSCPLFANPVAMTLGLRAIQTCKMTCNYFQKICNSLRLFCGSLFCRASRSANTPVIAGSMTMLVERAAEKRILDFQNLLHRSKKKV